MRTLSALTVALVLAACSSTSSEPAATQLADTTTPASTVAGETTVAVETTAASVTTDTAPVAVDTVQALAELLNAGGVACTDVAGEEPVPGIQVDSGTCTGPGGLVLQLNVFATDTDAVAGRAFVGSMLQGFGITDAPGVVSGRVMVAGDSENPSAELLEQLVGVLGGEIVNLAGTT